jgi:putative nucleotidyltransferase with HDIG domain
MIQAVNDALLEVQGALLARSLYPENHPRIQASEQRAHRRLEQALESRPEIALFAVDGRVVFDSEILPSCTSLADTLFRMLQVYGVDQIRFRRGLPIEELRSLLDTLADTAQAGRRALHSTPHLGISSLQPPRHREESSQVVPKSSAIAYAEEAAEALPGIWQAVKVSSDEDEDDDDSRVELGMLSDIVTCISKVVNDTSRSLLPLAPLKEHDEYTFVHTVNVAILSTSLAEALGYDSRTVHEVNISALLHDVGKQEVPSEVLTKKSRFTDEERRLMQLHPVTGARMLLNTPGVPDLAVVVAYEHHIRADGSGYPSVPPGWKLNMASRIVQLTDVFDALRTNRPYRLGLPVPKIVEMMRNDVGTFFDADLLEVFFRTVLSRGIPESAGPEPVEQTTSAAATGTAGPAN